jgi:hypothetical protein
MAITTFDGFIASAKQYVSMAKTASRTSIAASWFSVFDLAGNPGAGVLAAGNTANGLVPTDATVGVPTISFTTGTGYLAQVDFGSSVACRMKLFDMLFKAGAYAFNANVALTAQPSYSTRVPSGTDFTDTQIWIEAVTAFTGNLSVAVTYTNHAGTAARTTGTVAIGAAPTVGRMIQLPLQSGDTGVQKIESVVATVSTVGTFNVLVLRPLWSGRVKIANDGDVHDLAKTGMPVVYADSAIILSVAADSTATGIPELEFVIANG